MKRVTLPYVPVSNASIYLDYFILSDFRTTFSVIVIGGTSFKLSYKPKCLTRNDTCFIIF